MRWPWDKLVAKGLQILTNGFDSFCTELAHKFFQKVFEKIPSIVLVFACVNCGMETGMLWVSKGHEYVKTLVGDEVMNNLGRAILILIIPEVIKRCSVWIWNFVAITGKQLFVRGGAYSTYNDPDEIVGGGGPDSNPDESVVEGHESIDNSPSSTDNNLGGSVSVAIRGRENVLGPPSSIDNDLGGSVIRGSESVVDGPSTSDNNMGGSRSSTDNYMSANVIQGSENVLDGPSSTDNTLGGSVTPYAPFVAATRVGLNMLFSNSDVAATTAGTTMAMAGLEMLFSNSDVAATTAGTTTATAGLEMLFSNSVMGLKMLFSNSHLAATRD